MSNFLLVLYMVLAPFSMGDKEKILYFKIGAILVLSSLE